MRSNEGIRIVIEIEVTDMARFTSLAEQAVAMSNDEPGTLVYDWYVDEASGTARLYEAYESMEALRVHTSGPVFSELGPQFMEVCRFTQLDVFGDAGAATGSALLGPTRWWGPAHVALSR